MKKTALIMKILVLNLIITGIPSIQFIDNISVEGAKRFKPYYNWNTFNTKYGGKKMRFKNFEF